MKWPALPLLFLLGLVFFQAAADLNITTWPAPPPPPPSTKRALTAVTATSAGASWVVSLSCLLPWTAVEAVAAAVPVQLPGCYLWRLGQAPDAGTALLNVNCSAARVSWTAAQVRSALGGSGGASVPAACRRAPLFDVTPEATYGLVPAAAATSTWLPRSWGRSSGNTTTSDDGVDAPWHLDRLDQRTLPLSGGAFEPRGAGGAGVTVYHIDTGARCTHAEFAPNRCQVIADYVSPAAANGDCNGHGTHTAALAVGLTYGVARAAALRAIRALDCAGNAQLSDIVLALMTVANRQACAGCAHAAVLTMSISGAANSMLNAHTSTLVTQYNVGVAVAAGNAASNACAYSPSSAAGVLSVGASDASDAFATFSNYGSGCVHVAAPGTLVTSAYYLDDLSTRQMSGTSMATPLMAGTMALLNGTAASRATLLALAAAGPVRVPMPGGASVPLGYAGMSALSTSVPPPTPPTPTPTPTLTPTPSPSPSPSPTPPVLWWEPPPPPAAPVLPSPSPTIPEDSNDGSDGGTAPQQQHASGAGPSPLAGLVLMPIIIIINIITAARPYLW